MSVQLFGLTLPTIHPHDLGVALLIAAGVCVVIGLTLVAFFTER